MLIFYSMHPLSRATHVRDTLQSQIFDLFLTYSLTSQRNSIPRYDHRVRLRHLPPNSIRHIPEQLSGDGSTPFNRTAQNYPP